MYKRTNEPPGRKPTFNRSLGTVTTGGSFPAPVNKMLQDRQVKRLLNWMVMNDTFKSEILAQVPDRDPPEPHV